MVSLSNNQHIKKKSGLMSKVIIIVSMNWRISVGVKRIVLARIITWSLILFLWQNRIMTGLLRVTLSLTTIRVLILRWDIHLQNQKDVLSLVVLMMGLPITHLLLIRLLHCHNVCLQILLKREIYLKRELKLILSANTSANNGLEQFGNKATMGRWNMWDWINGIVSSMP